MEGSDLVGSGVQDTVVVGGDVTERSEGTAVDQSVGLDSAQPALGVGVQVHLDSRGMPTAIDQEDLLAVEVDSHRPPGLTC